MKRGTGAGELVVRPQTLFSFHDQSGAAEISKMTGCGGLRNAQDAHDVANAELARQKQMKYAQSRGVGEGAEHTIDSCGAHKLHSLRRI